MGPHFGFHIRDSSFAVGLPVDREADPAVVSWRPLDALLDDSGVLLERYEQVRSVLSALADREIEFRVAASTGHLGLVARLICPVFGSELLGRELDLSQAWWQPTVGGAMPLSLPADAITPSIGRSEVTPSQMLWVTSPMIELVGRVHGLVEKTAALSLSRRVLWGNVASAVNGAATTVAGARPDLADDAAKLATSFVTRLNLTGTFVGQVGSSFRRRSCCLIYRIARPESAGQSYCGDCVLGGPDAATNSEFAVVSSC